MAVDLVVDFRDGLPFERKPTLAEIAAMDDDRLLQVKTVESELSSAVTEPSSHELFHPTVQKKPSCEFVPLDDKQKAIGLWTSGKRKDKYGHPKRLTFNKVKNRFSRVKDIRTLYR